MIHEIIKDISDKIKKDGGMKNKKCSINSFLGHCCHLLTKHNLLTVTMLTNMILCSIKLISKIII